MVAARFLIDLKHLKLLELTGTFFITKQVELRGAHSLDLPIEANSIQFPTQFFVKFAKQWRSQRNILLFGHKRRVDSAVEVGIQRVARR